MSWFLISFLGLFFHYSVFLCHIKTDLYFYRLNYFHHLKEKWPYFTSWLRWISQVSLVDNLSNMYFWWHVLFCRVGVCSMNFWSSNMCYGPLFFYSALWISWTQKFQLFDLPLMLSFSRLPASQPSDPAHLLNIVPTQFLTWYHWSVSSHPVG